MVARLGRILSKKFDGLLILSQQPSALRVYPRLGLTTVGKMDSVEKRPLVAFNRRGPLTRANRFLEFPGVDLDQVRLSRSSRPDDRMKSLPRACRIAYTAWSSECCASEAELSGQR